MNSCFKRKISFLTNFTTHLIFIVLTLTLYGFSWFSGKSRPEWVDHFIDENHFVGQSSLLPKDQLSNARGEAFDAALDQISRRLGVIIESELKIKEQSSEIGTISQVSRESKQSARHFLQDIKKSDEYIESEKKGQIVYVLIKMTDSDFKALEKKIALETEEFNLILDEVERALAVGEVQTAKSQLLRAEDSVYGKESKRFSELEKILNDLIILSAGLNKDFYIDGDNIEISVSTNKNSYVYVLSQTPDSIKIIFPNEADLQNHIQAGSQLILPTKKMVDENYLFKVDHINDKKEEILVIATKSPIEIATLSKYIRGGYYELEISQNAKWRERISSLMKSGDLTLKRFYPLSRQSETRGTSICFNKVKSSSLPDGLISNTVMDKVMENFAKAGFTISSSKCGKADFRLDVSIEMEIVYNPNLDEEVVCLTLNNSLYGIKGEELSNEIKKIYYTKGSDKELSTAISLDSIKLNKILSSIEKEKKY